MSVMSTEASSHIKDIFSSTYMKYLHERELIGAELLVDHIGGLDQHLVNGIAYDVEDQLHSAGADKATAKRVFSLVVEAIQNVYIHGEKKDAIQYSFFIVSRSESTYHVSVGNLVSKQSVLGVSNRLEKINGLNKDALKDLYMEVLTDGQISSKGGAGLGFITISMKAKSKLMYDFIDVDEELSLFVLDTKLEVI